MGNVQSKSNFTVLVVLVGIIVVMIGALFFQHNKYATKNEVLAEFTDGKVITEEEITEYVKQQYGNNVLQEQIATEFMDRELKDFKVDISEEEIQAEYDVTAKAYGSEEKLISALGEEELTKADLLKIIKNKLTETAYYVDYFEITDKEVEEFYEKYKDTYFKDSEGKVDKLDDVRTKIEQALIDSIGDEEYSKWYEEMAKKYLKEIE